MDVEDVTVDTTVDQEAITEDMARGAIFLGKILDQGNRQAKVDIAVHHPLVEEEVEVDMVLQTVHTIGNLWIDTEAVVITVDVHIPRMRTRLL